MADVDWVVNNDLEALVLRIGRRTDVGWPLSWCEKLEEIFLEFREEMQKIKSLSSGFANLMTNSCWMTIELSWKIVKKLLNFAKIYRKWSSANWKTGLCQMAIQLSWKNIKIEFLTLNKIKTQISEITKQILKEGSTRKKKYSRVVIRDPLQRLTEIYNSVRVLNWK